VTINITTFNPSMQDAVVQHILHIENDEFKFNLSLQDQPDMIDIELSYQTAGGQFWVATDNSRVIGTCALFNLGGADVDLRKMIVAKRYRSAFLL
jgi:hypothetical protein